MSLLSLLVVSGCVFDGDLKQDHGTVPEDLGDGWVIDTPESVGLSATDLDVIHDHLLREDRWLGTLGLLIIKDGRLVFETYLRSPADRDHVQHLQSATKSVTSLIFGISWDQGEIPSLDLRLADVFAGELAGLDPRKREITLEHLLTMRSGLAFDNEDFSMEMWVDEPADPVRYILHKPLYADPGARFYYRDADPQLLAYAMRRLTGRTEREIAEQSLFAPLGIEDVYWQAGRDGTSFGPYGLHLRPRDFAKIGMLLLDRGQWQGRRVVSEEWLERATEIQVPGARDNGTGEPFGYGYYIWIVDGVGVAASGHGGQFLLAVPERDLLVVQIALPDNDLHGSRLEDLLELVAPLLRSPGESR